MSALLELLAGRERRDECNKNDVLMESEAKAILVQYDQLTAQNKYQGFHADNDRRAVELQVNGGVR